MLHAAARTSPSATASSPLPSLPRAPTPRGEGRARGGIFDDEKSGPQGLEQWSQVVCASGTTIKEASLSQGPCPPPPITNPSAPRGLDGPGERTPDFTSQVGAVPISLPRPRAVGRRRNPRSKLPLGPCPAEGSALGRPERTRSGRVRPTKNNGIETHVGPDVLHISSGRVQALLFEIKERMVDPLNRLSGDGDGDQRRPLCVP